VEPELAPKTERAPFLAEGCPSGQHDVRGWKRIDPSSVSVDQTFSLNYSPCSWTVVVRDGAVLAEEHRDVPPNVPANVHLPSELGRPRIVQRGRSGILLGFNHGEWGGALLWYGNDGAFKRKLVDDNIVALWPTATGFTVYAGLSHLGSDTGRAMELVDSGSQYSVARSADLGSAPRAMVAETGGATVVATMTGIVRVQPDFQIQQVVRTRWGMYYPVSLAVHAGAAYVGMRGIVAEVTLAAGSAKETWLAPVDLK
jgi:hypothetical protein